MNNHKKGTANPQFVPSARAAIDPFIVMDVMQAAHEQEIAGHDVIHMEVGQPGTPAPDFAQNAARKAMSAGPMGYSLALGVPDLRLAIAQKYAEWYGITIDPERVIITTGSSAAFTYAFLSAFDPGDRLALPAPGYPCYRHISKALGLKPVTIETDAAGRWMPTLEDIERSHKAAPLRGLLLASPANPTGTMISNDRLRELAVFCSDQGIWFISDEIYHGLTYEAPNHSAIEHSPDAIIVNSFSKYFSMTGWRVGWMIVPEQLVRPIERLAQNLYIAPPTISQMAALGALEAGEELEKNKEVYARNREILLSELPKAGFNKLLPADGAFYIYADVSALTDDSKAFAKAMLTEAHVATTPGHDFDEEYGHKYLRFSYSRTTDDMVEAMQRLKKWRGSV